MCQIYSQQKVLGFFLRQQIHTPTAICAHKCWISVSWPVSLSDTRSQKMQILLIFLFLREHIVPKTQQADLSLVSTRSRPPVSPKRAPGRLLMHSTTSTHIWVCTQTYTEGCLQYASEPPSWHPNAKCLANKYRDKCINTRPTTCSHFSCIFHRNLPMFTHSLTTNKPRMSSCTRVHISTSLFTCCAVWGCNPLSSTYNIIFFYSDCLSAFMLALYYPLCTLYPWPNSSTCALRSRPTVLC